MGSVEYRLAAVNARPFLSVTVRLGLSPASYRWMAYPWLRTDSSTYRYSVGRLPYFEGIEAPRSADVLPEWMMDRARAHGLTALYMDAGWLGTDMRAAAFGDALRVAGIELYGGADPNLAAGQEEWGAIGLDAVRGAREALTYRLTEVGHGWTGGTEFQRAVRAIQVSAAAGATLVNVVHREAAKIHRFVEEPPLARQLDAVIRNLRSLIPVAEDLGVILTTEAHMDYRVADLVHVMEAVASPSLRHTFDFANSISVVEDPLDAARLVAPYTVATHIKDMRVQPTTEIGEPMFFHSPIGTGDVPILEILQVLQDGSPDAARMHHCVEVMAPPEHDAEAWVAASIAWLRSHAARFFA